MKYFDRPAAWFVLIAILFESALGVVAVGVGGIFSYWPLIGLPPRAGGMTTVAAVGWGLVAAAPMTLTLAIVAQSRFSPLVRLREQAEKLLVPLLAGCHPFELALVALVAGMGEEILFRGLIQEGLARWWSGLPAGWLVAWLVASLLFGVCHWLSGTYAFLAMLAGLYLGLLLLAFDHLLVPITAHAMYDLAALVFLTHDAPAADDATSATW
jgi:hypothetical protein